MGVAVGAPGTVTQSENSEVSLVVRFVAVAATDVWPACRAKTSGPKLALHAGLAAVVTSVVPRRIRPWPIPERAQDTSEKNSSRNVVPPSLFNVPEIVTLPAPNTAEVMTGKFWAWLLPLLSPSQAS